MKRKLQKRKNPETKQKTTSIIELRAVRVNVAELYQTATSATVPFTWASGDSYYASGTYEAA